MQKLEYRPALDGIRTIAIVSVLIFHLNENWLSGGFIGVDVFFVLSGYLITSIIQKEIFYNDFSFTRFYQRRIARIFPVYFLVTILTLIVAKFTYTIMDYSSVGAVAVAATLFMANIKYMLQGGYFEVSADAQPLMHYWSLSVEEQFYLLFPFILVILYKYLSSKSITIFKIIIFMGLASFLFSIYLTPNNPVWAFYLLPTRAWELLAGSALAIYVMTNEHKSKNSFMQIVGLVIILCSFIFIDKTNGFPGFIAVVPIFGTILLIYSSNKNGFTERLLSLKPMVYIGLISYSLYIWHWPIFSFIDYNFYEISESMRVFSKVFLTIFFALLSYYYIEKPSRNYLNSKKRKTSVFILFPIILLLISFLSYEVRVNNHIAAKTSSLKDGGVVINSNIENTSIVLFGDSNAAMYGTSIRDVAKELNIKVHVLAVNGMYVLPGFKEKEWEESIKFIKQVKPKFIVYANSWAEHIDGNYAIIDELVMELKQHTDNLVLITQPPILPKYASREEIRKYGKKIIYEEKELMTLRTSINSYVKNIKEDNVIIIDSEPLFIDEDNSILLVDKDGNKLYQDSTHLSGVGSDSVINLLFPILKDKLYNK